MIRQIQISLVVWNVSKDINTLRSLSSFREFWRGILGAVRDYLGEVSGGKIKANAFMTYSSARFKEDVQVIDNPIETIQNLRGVTFTWKKNDQKDYGFIAEEVGKELPIIVEWDNKNSENPPQAMSMDYTRIIPILLEGIKSQQNQIDILKEEIKCLKQGTEPI